MRNTLHVVVALSAAHLACIAGFVISGGGKPNGSADRTAKGLPHGRRDEFKGEADGASVFTLPQIHNPRGRNRTGLELLVRTYAKYGVPLTPELEHALSVNEHVSGNVKRGTVRGTVSASPPGGYDYEYLSPVQLGTPPQTVNLNIDTGSGDFWVFSSDTPKAQVNGQRIYRPGSSSTAKKLPNYTWKIGYGDGSGASGIVYTDKVAIGSAAVATQAIESATQVSPEFTSDAPSSGILGMGMGKENTVRPIQQKTFLENVASSLLAPLFTANLKHSIPGNYNFGYINTLEYKGAIQYVPVDINSIYWMFTPIGYQIGKGAYTVAPWKAIADTGTTLLLLPDNMVSAYYKQVKGAGFDRYWGGILFPCLSSLPDFTFGYGTYRGLVPGRYINYGHVNATYCYGGIQSSAGIGFSIFGDMVLKAQFVVFDLGQKRIGWAQKVFLT